MQAVILSVLSAARARRPLVLTWLCVALLLLASTGAGRAQLSPPPALTEGVSRAVLRRSALEGRVLWLDGTANLERLSTREGVARVLDRCVRARINTIVVDVRPLSGHVLYQSSVAPRLTEWRGFQYPEGYDLLRTVLEEGHRRGLKVHAAINVFSDGHKLFRSGPIYQKPALQSLVYDVERTVTTPRGERRVISIGVNRNPGPNEISVYDSGYRNARPIGPAEAFVLVQNGRVEAVVDGSLSLPDGVVIPTDSYVLVGQGEGARWLIQHVRIGDQLQWTARERFLPIVDAPSETIAAFFNPSHPEARDYLWRLTDELIDKYAVDGIVFDRMRYSSLQSDFSPLSRQQFEQYLGTRLNRFPADVLSFDADPGRALVRGPYFKQWLEWRAGNIRSWLEEATRRVRARRPEAKVGVYVGSWYPTYYTVGVNWGSEEFAPGYDWMSPTYNRTGYAHLLDWITTGCYHPVATREQARLAGLDENFTVQAAAETSMRAVGDMAFVYAGLFVRDYENAPAAFRAAMQAARQYSHGVMLFDLSHLEDYGWWPHLESEFSQAPPPRAAPHDLPDLLPAVRDLRRALNQAR